MRSAANMPLILGSLEEYLKDPTKVAFINIQLFPLQESHSFGEMLVHEVCGSKVDYEEICPHCDRTLEGAAIGGKSEQPTKLRACNHKTCNKSLVGHDILSVPYCNQDGCTRKLKDGEIVKRVSSKQSGQTQLVALSDVELAQLNAMRLSHPTDSRDAFKCMVVRGIRHVHSAFPYKRVSNVRQVAGQMPDDQEFVWDMIQHLRSTGERIVVHYAFRHINKLNSDHEHVALLMVDSKGKSLLLLDLLDDIEVRTTRPMPDDHEMTDERADMMRDALSKLPVIRDDHPDLLSTRFSAGLKSTFKAKVENEEWEPPTFVDHDGMVRAAAGNLFLKLIRRGAVLPLEVETPPSK